MRINENETAVSPFAISVLVKFALPALGNSRDSAKCKQELARDSLSL